MSTKVEIIEPTVVSVEALKDFQTCALLYDFRHQQKRYESYSRADELSVRYENVMKRIVSFYFYKKQSGIVPSVSALLNRWEKNWFPKDMTAYDLATEQTEMVGGNLVSFSADATRSLLRFYEEFTPDLHSDPLLINEDYVIPITDTIHLTGSFDLVLRDKKGLYTVIKWVTNPSRRVMPSHMVMDFAALRTAFDYRNEGRNLKVRYGYYDLVTASKFGFHEVDVTKADVNALAFWAEDAANTKVFVPRRGLTSYCRGCPFDVPCKEFTLTETMLKVKRNHEV